MEFRSLPQRVVMSKCFWRKRFLCQLFENVCPMIVSLTQLNCSAVSLIVFSLLLQWSSKSVSHSLWVIIPRWNFLQNGIHSFLSVVNYFSVFFCFSATYMGSAERSCAVSCFKKTWASTTTFSHKDYFHMEGLQCLLLKKFFQWLLSASTYFVSLTSTDSSVDARIFHDGSKRGALNSIWCKFHTIKFRCKINPSSWYSLVACLVPKIVE